jgi:hypothetical protein
MLHHLLSAGESSPHGGALFYGGAPPEQTADSFAPLPRRSSSPVEPGTRSSDRTARKDSDSGAEPPMYDGPFCAAPPRKASRAIGLGASYVVGALVVGALVLGAVAVLGPRKPKMATRLCNSENVADICHSNDNAPTLTITGLSALDRVAVAARADDCCRERIVAATITYSLDAQGAWSPTSAAAAVGARLSDNSNHTQSGEFVGMAQ